MRRRAGLDTIPAVKKLPIYILFLLVAFQVSLLAAQEDSWESVTPMPTARESVAACAVDGRIYALGGFPGGSDRGITTNERYDPATDSWATMAPMPTGRRMPVTGVVDGKCYVIGGRTTDGQTPLDVVEAYDPASNSWQTRSSMPTARYGHVAAVVNGIIYVFAGAGRNNLVGATEAYDPSTDQWTTLSSFPIPRALLGAAAYGGKIYLMGGTLDGNTSRYNRLDIYDPATDTWSVGPNMPLPKYSLTAAVANGRIYAIGGADGPGALNDVAAFDPGSGEWTVVSPMNTRRARFASAAVDNRIYAIGGTISFGNPHVGMDRVERYTPEAAGSGFVINPGLNDAWYNRATDGQGLLIAVFPVIKLMFAAWFTYDTERPPGDVEAILGDPGHRWLTAQGPYSGDTANLKVFVTAGGEFDAAEPPAMIDLAGDGTLTIEFADCESALVSYEITSLNLSGEIPIERVVPDNVALCEALSDP